MRPFEIIPAGLVPFLKNSSNPFFKFETYCQDRTNHLSTRHPSSHLSTDPFEFAILGSSDLDLPLHPLASNNLEHHPSPLQP
jgi:hypothetical protein